MKRDWKKCKVGEHIKFQSGCAFRSDEFTDRGNCNVVKIKELKDGKVKFTEGTEKVDYLKKYEKFVVKKGDVLFALTGDPVSRPNPLSRVGRVAIYTDKNEALLNQRVCKAIFDDEIDPYYFYYYFRNNAVFDSLAAKAAGSANQANISTKTISDMEMKFPPLDEQKKLAALLRTFDDKIENNNAIIENLQQQAFALYQQMFVDTPNSSRRICRAEQVFDISIGKTPPRKEREWFSDVRDNNVVWVSIADMGNCEMFISDSNEYLTTAAVDKYNVVTVSHNTVLLSFKLTVGRVAISDGEMTTNEAIAHFKTDNKTINEYLYCYLKKYNYQTLGSTSSIATAVNSKIIKAMPFIVPTESELKEFHSFAAPCFEKIRKNQVENKRLATLRNTLLPKLMSGEINVSNVQI